MTSSATDPVLVRAYLAALAGEPAPAPPVRSRSALLRERALRRLAHGHHRHSRARGNPW